LKRRRRLRKVRAQGDTPLAREVDKSKTRKALRKLKRVAARVEAGEAKPLTDWEQDFVAGVGQRLETYGSAFRDPQKGSIEEALSARQAHIVRTLDKKTRPKTAEGAEPDKPVRKGMVRKGALKPRSARRMTRETPPPQPEDEDTPETRRAMFRVVTPQKS
jgi:hypothetical protein